MSIQLDIQIIVPDENREKLLLLMEQAEGDIEDYFRDNPTSSPDFPLNHNQAGVGTVDLHYQLTAMPAPFVNVVQSFAFQTVNAAVATKVFSFPTAATVRLLIVASNAGNTKGLAYDILVTQSLTLNNTQANNANDFGTANASVNAVPNSITLDMTGEAGETIDWKVLAMVMSV